MTEKISQRRHHTCQPMPVPVILFVAIATVWLGPSSRGSARAQESAREGEVSGHTGSLPSDLTEVPEAPYAPLDGLAPGSAEAQEQQRQVVRRLGLPLEVRTRRTEIVFRLIPAGEFTIGSPSSESGRDDDEIPREVRLTKPFYCGKFEITQGQWAQVMRRNPSRFKNAGRNAPVEQVCWEDCQAFVKKVCEVEGVPEGTYRLLTEAEWEYGCRAGSKSAYYFGDSGFDLARYAWYLVNSNGQTHVVGQRRPNGWGLYDIYGNVWEWCQDRFGAYGSDSATDPSGPPSGSVRIFRGDAWNSADCRSANRAGTVPDLHRDFVGLRIARTIPSAPH